VPQPIALPIAAPVGAAEGLCVGGELKNTVAVVRGNEVILSQHLGDLTHALAFQYFQRAVNDLQRLCGVRPRWIATDQHPLYLSTAYAKSLAKQLQVPLLEIQHHHAHAAAVMAEHGVCGPTLAIVCDGVGYGTDGAIWGGELLAVDLVSFERLARIRPLRLPGGDAAARDVRRCGLALLRWLSGDQATEHPAARRLFPASDERQLLGAMLRHNVNCVESSAAGRVFDGVAALLGLAEHNDFEAQAAMRLESAAYRHAKATSCTDGLLGDEVTLSHILEDQEHSGLQCIDLAPLVRQLIERRGRGCKTENLAYLFHDQLAVAWDAAVGRASVQTGIHCVALSGGVFSNELLTSLLTDRLERRGLQVLRHKIVPPNDGGLALGQAATAAARLSRHVQNGVAAPMRTDEPHRVGRMEVTACV
jgi:hydrogenase maturation protein HypF